MHSARRRASRVFPFSPPEMWPSTVHQTRSTNMHAVAVLVSLLSLGIINQKGPDRDPSAIVKTCVEADSASPWIVQRAEMGAVAMFAKIGVKIEWQSGVPDCRGIPDDVIVIRFSNDRGDPRIADALGRAWFNPPSIQVFYDRIVEAVEDKRIPDLLA